MNYIVDDIGLIVQAMRGMGEVPYYMYGHRKEIASRLTQKDKDKTFKYQKYPLIALRLDIPEERTDGMVRYSLNIAILAKTEKKYNAEERYTEVIKPILAPLYKSFFKELRNAGLFQWPGMQDEPEHTKIDRPFWGITEGEGNSKYIFDDPLDAIEIIDLKLNQRIKQ